VGLAVAASPFGVGLALGYPRAAAPSLLCGAIPDTLAANSGCATETRLAYLESLLLAGAALGALVAGRLADLVGRRGALRLASAVAVLGWVLGELVFGAGTRFGLVGRFLVGMSAGASTTASNLLAAETASPGSRGFVLAALQVAVAAGLAVANLCALFASDANESGRKILPHWRQVALFAASVNAVSTASAGGMFGDARLYGTAPESPRWLATRGRDGEARVSIAAARGLSTADPRVVEEAEAIIDAARPKPSVSTRALESGSGFVTSETFPLPNVSRWTHNSFALARWVPRGVLSRAAARNLALVFVTTLGGVSVTSRNAFVSRACGFPDTPAAAFAFACSKVFGGLMSLFLFRENGVGRRVAFLWSACGMLAAHVAVVSSLVLTPPSPGRHAESASLGDTARSLAPLVFAFAHAVGAAATPWVVAAESFSQDSRSTAVAALAAAHWSYLWDIDTGFGPATTSVTGSIVMFGVFGMICSVGLSLTAPRGQKFVPDADGLSLERARGVGGGKAPSKRGGGIGIADGF
jgi:MFS family permease